MSVSSLGDLKKKEPENEITLNDETYRKIRKNTSINKGQLLGVKAKARALCRHLSQQAIPEALCEVHTTPVGAQKKHTCCEIFFTEAGCMSSLSVGCCEEWRSWHIPPTSWGHLEKCSCASWFQDDCCAILSDGITKELLKHKSLVKGHYQFRKWLKAGYI